MQAITDQKQIVNTLEQIQVAAEKRAKRATQRYGTLSAGDWHAQGDVMFEKLPGLPKNAKPTEAVAQLAPGTSRGSRHVIKADDLPKCKFYRVKGANVLFGPIIETSDFVEVEHPDHGHVVLPKGTYQIHYQRQYSPKVIKRVID